MKNVAILFALFLGLSCQNAATAQTKINAEQTTTMLKNDASVQLVDLRTPGEIAATGKIEGAKTINFNSPDFQTQIGQLDKSKPVLLYCAAGGRSGKASSTLQNMGFKKVFDYTGGMNDWKAKGLPTVK